MRLATMLVLAGILSAAGVAAAQESADIIVYGGTSGGVVAAVQAGREGKSVILIEPTKHVGGMTTGGLGATDMGNEKAIGGVSREFYQRVLKHYESKSAWKYETKADYEKREKYYRGDALFGFEPHVAEDIYGQILAEAKVKVVFGERLDLKDGVEKKGTQIISIKMESGKVFAGKMFIDASYEGDLLAKAGVSYMCGREANSEYGETLNGVEVVYSKSHQFKGNIPAYWKPGDKSSGLIPLVRAEEPGRDGQADKRQQAYNYRLCLTDVEKNRVPFSRPANYDERQYEALLRLHEIEGASLKPWNPRGMPNRKTDTNNNGAFSTDFIGKNYDYPKADYATRDKIIAEHIEYTKGLMWTLTNHPRISAKFRESMSKWGWAKDEFVDTDHFPRQLYVREARRMLGAYVMMQNDIQGKRTPTDSIGLGSYGMDSHNTQRYVDKDGFVRNEGDVEVHGFEPYPISYRSLVPKPDQCTNLLVPVCMSATHIAYGSIRMEPVYMIMGQACGTAACVAIDDGADVQKVEYAKLRKKLLEGKQLLEWGGKVKGGVVTDAGNLSGIVMDSSKAKLTGEWLPGKLGGVGGGYLHDDNKGKGQKSARFELQIPADGMYEVWFAYVPNANRATNVPVTVESAEGSKTVIVNEKRTPPIDKAFISLGTYQFTAEKGAVIVVSNEKTDGHVIIDAVQVIAK